VTGNLFFQRAKWLGAIFFLAVWPAAPQQPLKPSEVVSPTIYSSLEPAARGSSFQIAVIMKIHQGYHVNAREKSMEYLIATDLKAQMPGGFTAGEVAYPKGTLKTFSFSKTPLNVYQDTVTLLLPIKVLANAPLGAQKIPLKLRYQACNDELCLPPFTLNLESNITVAASASAAKPAHAEIFSAK
jgi:hypothetical protein